MGIIAVDLGTTNVKVAIYDEALNVVKKMSRPVQYIRNGVYVEFDAIKYVNDILDLISYNVRSLNPGSLSLNRIVLTGQAESLVMLDTNGRPLMNAISWMDDRSTYESKQLESQFSKEEYYQKTGQLAVFTTWPVTKILWLRHNKPEIFKMVARYVLLKDYVVYCLTGKLMADCSIATFSFYFDIQKKCYWNKMLDACGIRLDQLPELVEPCTNAGPILESVKEHTGLGENTNVNIGTLDHFASMIGTGNLLEGIISVSIGTTMAIATKAHQPLNWSKFIPLHYGFIPDTFVILPVSDSGGASLEWYKNNFMPDCSYAEMDNRLKDRKPNEIIFLPYVTGTNSPEFESDASGMFYGLRAKHDALDLAYAVMEGVAYLLDKNIAKLAETGINVDRIIATGGGAKSEIWCQLFADVTGIPVEVPMEKDTSCFGAAIIGAVEDGLYSNYSEAAEKVVKIKKRFVPVPSELLKQKKEKFSYLYRAALETARLNTNTKL